MTVVCGCQRLKLCSMWMITAATHIERVKHLWDVKDSVLLLAPRPLQVHMQQAACMQ